MAKTINMVAVIDGDEVTVGRCHPGQARLLRKYGMAEWVKGKLVLPQTDETMTISDGGISLSGSVESWLDLSKQVEANERLLEEERKIEKRKKTAQDNGWIPHSSTVSWTRGVPNSSTVTELLDEIDPEQEVLVGRSGEDRPTPPEEIICDSVVQWVKEIKSRRKLGHPLLMVDEPRRLMLGFVDDTDNKWFGLKINTLKRAGSTEFLQAGIERDHLASREGRICLIQEDQPLFPDLEPEEPREDDPTLANIWMEEADQELQAYQANLGVNLGEALFGTPGIEQTLALSPWSEDVVRKMCDLKPRAEYLAEYHEWIKKFRAQDHRPLWEPGRRSGRSTELLIRAVTAALQGHHVTFRAENRDMENLLMRRASHMIMDCGMASDTSALHHFKVGQPKRWKVFREHPIQPGTPNLVNPQHPCPYCGAKPGEPCTTYPGLKKTKIHAFRKQEELRWVGLSD